MASQKALDAIGKSLQAQCERWQPRARSKLQLDPTVEASSGQVKLRLHEGAGSDSRTNLKDFGQLLVDADKFASQLQVWLQDKLAGGKCRFRSPFQLNELQELDYALEGVVFGQAVQMPLAVQKPELSGFATGADVYMALEDFIFTSAQVLWENFWRSGEPLPFFVSSARSCRPQCQSAGLSQVKSDGIPGAALVGQNRGNNVLWENIAEVVELESREAGFKGEGKFFPGMKAIAQGLFHGLLMLVSRAVYQKNRVVQRNVDTAYVLLVTANYGGVIRLQGDVLKLELTTNDVYRSAANWFRSHADVAVSPLEKVWNKLGNANWRDVGALQFLLATFYCIEQCQGPALKSIAVRVANHNARLQRHRKESSGDYSLEGRSVRQSEQNAPISRGNSEIVEVEQYVEPVPSKDMGLKLEPGTTVWLDNFNWQRGFYIKEDLGNGRRSVYSATSRDDHNKLFLLYIGPHPSQLESSQQTWEDMSTWYQVHRQTKILNILKQKGISSKYLPQLVASGRLVHSSPCKKQNVGSRCDHPYCGIPVLVTSPAGEPLAMVMEKEGVFPAEEALRCCHDCLSALRSAKSAGIQHGEITLDHVMRVKGADAKFYYVLVDWGHAVLGDRDSPGLSQRYAPTFALQQGKLCPASDSESLTYLLFILCGGVIPEFDSLEAVLKWRERAWSKRVIQLQLGEVSAVLKAFADYVDSLCRTPYPMDYDIWLRRLQVALHDDDASQKIEFRSPSGRFEFTGESSGGSGAQSS